MKLGAKRSNRTSSLRKTISIRQNGVDTSAKSPLWGPGFFPGLAAALDLGKPVVNYCLTNFVLRFEVIVNIAEGDTRLFGYVGEGSLAETLPISHFRCRLYQTSTVVCFCRRHLVES